MASLQLLCLRVIVEKFDQFYVVSTEQILQFLQRRYSNELAVNLLKQNEKNVDNYFDFLFNKHLNYVDFNWFKNSQYLNSIDDIFSRLPNLTVIEFKVCGNKILESIAKFCPNIVEIKASSSDVSDKGIKCLFPKNGVVPCPKLKIISLRETSVTNTGVHLLFCSSPYVEKIEFESFPLVLYHLSKNLKKYQIVPAFKITELNFKECNGVSSDVIKTCLSVCPKLDTVHCNIYNEQELEALNSRPLKKLFLFCIRDVKFDNFLKAIGSSLIYLNIFNCTISTPVLVEHCPNLKFLNACEVEFTNEGDQQLIFPSLSFCFFAAAFLDKIAPFFNSSVPKLKEVFFTTVQPFVRLEKQFLIWCRNSELETIYFMWSPLRIEFLKDILLFCHSLKLAFFVECTYDGPNHEEILNAFAETLPNKPNIFYFKHTAGNELFEYLHR